MKASNPRGGGAACLHHRIRAESGMVTAEFAIALLAVLPVMFAVIAMTAAAALQVRAVEAARTAARALARGESESAARQIVADALPQAQVEVLETPERATVIVEHRVMAFGAMPAFTIRGQAVTPLEVASEP